MSEERVRIHVQDHVATVTMVRADKHNAVDLAMFEGLDAAAAEVTSTPGVRVVVLHGDGPSFCSGIDLAGLLGSQSNGASPFNALQDASPNLFQRAAYAWIEAPVPVIAAVHGNCFGAGVQIALGADIRFCTPDARLSIMESKWGLVPDMAITRTLTRLVPIDVAKELIYTARTLSGTEAKELGLVTHVVDDPLAAAQQLATEITRRSPDAIRAAKRLIDTAWTGSPEETLGLEARLQLGLMGQPNQLAAVTAGMAKQTAEFVDPS
jgi:enoyl-CoA hydratase/carnithine racemase